MDHSSPVWRFLERTADVVVVGCLTTVAGAAVITAPAALAAAVHVLAHRERSTSLLTDYLRALRAAATVGIQLGAVSAAALLVGAVDVLWATSAPLTPVTTAVLSAGVLVVLATCAVTATAVVRTSGSACAGSPPPRLGQLLRRASLEAAAAPGRSLALALLTATAAVVGFCAAALVPLVVGLVALLLPVAVPPSAVRRAPLPSPAVHALPSGARS